jgi:hypothetical protein
MVLYVHYKEVLEPKYFVRIYIAMPMDYIVMIMKYLI